MSLLNLRQRIMKLQVGERSWISSIKVRPRVLELLYMDLKYVLHALYLFCLFIYLSFSLTILDFKIDV